MHISSKLDPLRIRLPSDCFDYLSSVVPHFVDSEDFSTIIHSIFTLEYESCGWLLVDVIIFLEEAHQLAAAGDGLALTSRVARVRLLRPPVAALAQGELGHLAVLDHDGLRVLRARVHVGTDLVEENWKSRM